MKQLFLRLYRDEEAQDLTEYALLLVLVALAANSSMNALANAVNGGTLGTQVIASLSVVNDSAW